MNQGFTVATANAVPPVSGHATRPTIRDELLQAEKDFPPDWIEDAFRETARQNKHNWKYTAAILRSWKDNGSKRTGTKAENTPVIDTRSLASEVYE